MKPAQFINVLEACARGELSCVEARELIFSDHENDFAEIAVIAINLNHYWDDEDIRLRDPDYRAMQDQELAKLIRHLERADYTRALEISFLHKS